tara:strand:+ start:8875 stop:9249 length:375 start_codon:yes stop_codon:yes gene_type:complete
MSLHEKQQEIKDFCLTRLQEIAEYDEDFKSKDVYDLHNEIFNMDYYIVGYYQASQWLGADAFDCIGEIQDYEKMHFGESHTDFGNSEAVANMYAYVVGMEIIEECFEQVCDELEDEEESEEEVC